MVKIDNTTELAREMGLDVVECGGHCNLICGSKILLKADNNIAPNHEILAFMEGIRWAVDNSEELSGMMHRAEEYRYSKYVKDKRLMKFCNSAKDTYVGVLEKFSLNPPGCKGLNVFIADNNKKYRVCYEQE